MGPLETADLLEQRRRWAMQCLEEGDTQEEVAEFFGVATRTIQRWWQRWQDQGPPGLALRSGRGRPPKLNPAQAEQVLDWLDHSPTAFGFATERWTAPRLASLIDHRLGIQMNHRYLNDWLRHHGITPQLPQPQSRGRDEALIEGWKHWRWPPIKKS